MNRFWVAAFATLIATNSFAATPSPAATSAPAPIDTATPAQRTSALFFSTCATSNGQVKNFAKKMQSLVDAKTAVKMAPDKLKDMVNEDEAKNAWAVKGFSDPNKPLLLTYNTKQNICGMHVSDVSPDDARHAFQADLKKLADLTKAKVAVYKPQKTSDITAYQADLAANGKTMQLGIALSPAKGETFFTVHQ